MGILCSEGLLDTLGSDVADQGGLVRPLETDSNESAIEALRLMEPTVPLKLQFKSSLMADSAALAMGNIIFGPQGGPTVWSKILKLGSMYYFTVIPKIETAEVVPFVPVLKSSLITKTIYTNEYNDINRSTYSKDQVRGAVLLGTGSSIGNEADTDTICRGEISI